MPRPRPRRTTHQSRRAAPPQTQPRALYCVPRKRPSTKAMGSTEHNPFFKLLEENIRHFQQNPLYIDITKPKSYKDGGNDAKYIMMHVKSQTPGVFNAHVSVVSFFDPRSQDIGKVRPLEHHLHLSVRYQGQSEESPRIVRVYLKHRQGKNPKCKYVDNSGKPPLDPETQAQIKEDAIKFAQPLLELMDEQINDLERRVADLKERITILNSQLARATEPDQKLDLVRKLYALHQKGLKILTSPHYRQLTLIRDNHTSSTDAEGFHTPGRSTKNRHYRILFEVLKRRIPILRQAVTQLESEAAVKSQASATNLPAKPRRNNKKHKKTQAGKRQTQPEKPRVKIAEDPLASYLKKANNWTQALTQAWDAFAEQDLAHWRHSLQDEVFTNQCILFDADSETLKALCQPENIDFLRDLLYSQREALTSGIDDNPETLITIFKELIRARNLDGIFALNDELNLNADDFLFRHTRKSLIHHMTDFAAQDDNEKSHVQSFSSLCNRGFPLPHIGKGCRTDYNGYSFNFSGLAYAAYFSLFELAEAYSTKAGAVDQLCMSQRRTANRQRRVSRSQLLSAFDFAAIATLEHGESPEKSRARIALASTHTPDIQQRTLDRLGRIFVQYINKETKAEDKLQKTLSLLNILSEYTFIHLPKNLSKKELQKHIFSELQTAQTKYQQAKDKQNPENMSKSYILGAVAWYTLHRLNLNIVETEESAMQLFSRATDSAKNLFSNPEKRYQHKIHLVQEAGAIDFDPIFTDPTFTNYIISKKILQLSPSHITSPRYTLSALMKAETAWTSKRFEDLKRAKAQYEARASALREPSPLATHAGQESQKPRGISRLFFDNHAADNAQQPGIWSDALPSLGGCHVL